MFKVFITESVYNNIMEAEAQKAEASRSYLYKIHIF